MAELISRSSPDPEPHQQYLLECRRTSSAEELRTHFRIRDAIFVQEQALFTGDDRDSFDGTVTVEHIVGYVDGQPAGTVRLYPVPDFSTDSVIDENLWKGDRLAVFADQRHSGIAGKLVRYAVARASERGGDRMIALIQVQNVPIFRHLGWVEDGQAASYLGQPHQQMSIGLQ